MGGTPTRLRPFRGPNYLALLRCALHRPLSAAPLPASSNCARLQRDLPAIRGGGGGGDALLCGPYGRIASIGTTWDVGIELLSLLTVVLDSLCDVADVTEEEAEERSPTAKEECCHSTDERNGGSATELQTVVGLPVPQRWIQDVVSESAAAAHRSPDGRTDTGDRRTAKDLIADYQAAYHRVRRHSRAAGVVDLAGVSRTFVTRRTTGAAAEADAALMGLVVSRAMDAFASRLSSHEGVARRRGLHVTMSTVAIDGGRHATLRSLWLRAAGDVDDGPLEMVEGEECSRGCLIEVVDGGGGSPSTVAVTGGPSVPPLWVSPGWTDSHVHLTDAARRLGQVSMKGVTRKSQWQERLNAYVEDAARKAGGLDRLGDSFWILGGDWNEELFEASAIVSTRSASEMNTGGEKQPLLRAASAPGGVGGPDITWFVGTLAERFPAMLMRYDVHSAVCNAEALRRSGITARTPNPEGGVIEHFRAAGASSSSHERQPVRGPSPPTTVPTPAQSEKQKEGPKHRRRGDIARPLPEPSGLLRETAIHLARRTWLASQTLGLPPPVLPLTLSPVSARPPPAATPPPSTPSWLADLRRDLMTHAIPYLLSNGICGVHSMTSLDFPSVPEMCLLQAMAEKGQLPIRVWTAARLSEAKELADALQSGTVNRITSEKVELRCVDAYGRRIPGDDVNDDQDGSALRTTTLPFASLAVSPWLFTGGVKGFVDGSLGSRTARMRVPYRTDGGQLGQMSSDATNSRRETEVDGVAFHSDEVVTNAAPPSLASSNSTSSSRCSVCATLPSYPLGLFLQAPEQLRADAVAAHRLGFQLCLHAIGDAAIDLALNVAEDISTESSPQLPRADNGDAGDAGRLMPRPRSPRLRIEHAQHATKADVRRMARLGAIASVQPSHLVDDAAVADRVVTLPDDDDDDDGQTDAAIPFPLRFMADEGVRLAMGSDWMVMPAEPLQGIVAGALRLPRRELDRATAAVSAASRGRPASSCGGGDDDGDHPLDRCMQPPPLIPWLPSQRLSVREVVDGYTRGAAVASFTDDSQGRIEVGFLADLTIIDRPLVTEDDPISTSSLSPAAAGRGAHRDNAITASEYRPLVEAAVVITITDGRVRYVKPPREEHHPNAFEGMSEGD